MKLNTPNFTVLAGISYFVFAAFGVATWCTLLFIEVPKDRSAWGLAKELLQAAPLAQYLQVHAASTLLSAVLAMLLLRKPAAGSMIHLAATMIAIGFAALAWVAFASEAAILPAVSAFALLLSRFTARTSVPD